MWPAAFVALFTAGPFGAVLFVAALITQGLKVAKVDAEYAKLGKTPPSHSLIEKWLDSRTKKGAKPQKPAKYGMWAYAWQRWQAMWEDLAEQHKEVRGQYKTAVADAKANGKPLPPKPTFKETLKGWKWQIDQLTTPAPTAVPAAAATDEPDPATPRPSPCPDDSPMPEVPRFYPDAPAAICDDLDRRQPRTTDAAPNANPQTPLATNPQGDPMVQPTSPQQSGEVVGLTSAINYAEAVAAAHNAHSQGGGEQYLSSLGQAEVGPETIQSAAHAQEMSAIAAAAWADHGVKLKEQLAAKEAVTNETGKKEFLLAD